MHIEGLCRTNDNRFRAFRIQSTDFFECKQTLGICFRISDQFLDFWQSRTEHHNRKPQLITAMERSDQSGDLVRLKVLHFINKQTHRRIRLFCGAPELSKNFCV